jgi:ribosomal protein S18 acetylase RimI-like enzyme
LYIKEWIKTGTTRKELIIRLYTKEDFEGLIDIQRECFPPPFPEELHWSIEQLKEHIKQFPQGAFCAEIDGVLVGSITTLITRYQEGDQHSWSEVTDHGYIRNHDAEGNTLYVVDISVRPNYRSYGIGKRLLQSMYYLVVQLGLEQLLGGGRMPNYHRYYEQLTPEEYIDQVIKGEIGDPVISFMLNNGRSPIGIAYDYLEDEESKNCAALMAWRNPFIPL